VSLKHVDVRFTWSSKRGFLEKIEKKKNLGEGRAGARGEREDGKLYQILETV